MEPDNTNKDSLEQTTTSSVIETDSLENSDNIRLAPGQQPSTPPEKQQRKPFKRLFARFNIYLLLFGLLLVISAGVLVVTAFSPHTTKEAKITSQSLPTDTLKQLAASDATVGDPKQVLNVQSNAVFAGKVLIQGSLDVAGTIHVNGALTLPGIMVSGDSSFDQVEVNKNLTVGGDSSVLGQLNVKKNLAVSGGGTFGGTLTAPQIATSQLQLVGDLALSRHIVAGGATPARASGTALGNGGTSSVSGSDTAGSLNINTGSGPAVGCFLTINFTIKYNNTPHVVISPTTSSAASLDYYVNRTLTGFSVCTTSTPPANSSIGFDYIILG